MDNNDQALIDLREFSEAQQKVIIQLNKKIQKLEAEKAKLEETISKSPVQLFQGNISLDSEMATEEAICTMQIKRLEEISLGRELTLEETRKLEAFSKILATFRNNKEKPKNKTDNIHDSELLKLVENDDVNRK